MLLVMLVLQRSRCQRKQAMGGAARGRRAAFAGNKQHPFTAPGWGVDGRPLYERAEDQHSCVQVSHSFRDRIFRD